MPCWYEIDCQKKNTAARRNIDLLTEDTISLDDTAFVGWSHIFPGWMHYYLNNI